MILFKQCVAIASVEFPSDLTSRNFAQRSASPIVDVGKSSNRSSSALFSRVEYYGSFEQVKDHMHA